MIAHERIAAVRRVVSRELDLRPEELVNNRSLRKDYGLDSVAAVNIIFALESLFDIEVSAADIAAVDSIDDIERLLAARMTR